MASSRLQAVNAHLPIHTPPSFGLDLKAQESTLFKRLIRFESTGGYQAYFYNLEDKTIPLPSRGDEIKAYSSFQDLLYRKKSQKVVYKRLLAPLPYEANQPIYCVGVNYRVHAEEVEMKIPQDPMLWVKPAAAPAASEAEIPINEFCMSNFPDFQGKLVFITSQECRDVSLEQAQGYILGYSIGNDLSCRFHQITSRGGGQFYFAKAFDKFGPIGPVLVSSDDFLKNEDTIMTTKVNGEPAEILSHMSQGTTIPAGTAVMTGTPGGVGVFQDPPRPLQHEDVVEIEVSGIGILRNKIIYQ